MRVIAGTYRSCPLRAPPGLATRPTSDRLRETLFDVLAGRLEGASFADLFAGSGAVGIEALSRGASHVSFIEEAPLALRAIRANLASLKIQSGFHIEARGVSAALRSFARASSPRPWDIAFLDPPYGAERLYQATLIKIGELASHLLAPNGIVVVEHRSRSEPLAPHYGPLERMRSLTQGDAALSFYRRSPG